MDIMYNFRMVGPYWLSATRGDWFDVHATFPEDYEWSSDVEAVNRDVKFVR